MMILNDPAGNRYQASFEKTMNWETPTGWNPLIATQKIVAIAARIFLWIPLNYCFTSYLNAKNANAQTATAGASTQINPTARLQRKPILRTTNPPVFRTGVFDYRSRITIAPCQNRSFTAQILNSPKRGA